MLYIVTYEQLSPLPFGRFMIYGMCQRSILCFLPFNIDTSRHERSRVAQLCRRMFSGGQFSKGKVPLWKELTARAKEVWDTDFASILRERRRKKNPQCDKYKRGYGSDMMGFSRFLICVQILGCFTPNEQKRGGGVSQS